MKLFFRFLSCLFVFVTLSFGLFGKSLYAVDFFDDFSGNLDNWLLENSGYSLTSAGVAIDGVYGWRIENGRLMGEAGYMERSYIFPKIDNLSNFDFFCKSENVNGVDQSFWFHVSADKKSYYEVNYRFNEPEWNQDNNNITLWKTINGSSRKVLDSRNIPGLNLNLTQNVVHDIRFFMEENVISIYFDSSLVLTYVDSSTLASGGFAMKNWGGAFRPGRVLNGFDDIKIIDLDSHSLQDKKVIIVPGLGASWNVDGLLGSDDVDLVWEMPFFVKHYENLKNAFIENGYVENQDVFIWPYDWRKPVAEIVENLDDFIEEVTDENDEIVVIGHSLGGLTARIWYQQNISDDRIDQVISLGSPHRGAVDAYELWNSGQASRPILQSIAYNILLLLNKDRTESAPQVIHRIAPVVKDLQPTLDFAYKDGGLVAFEELTDFNDYLVGKNSVDENSLLSLRTFLGTGLDTKEYLTLGQRTFFDERLGIWPDGHVLNRIYSQSGDGTVLTASAKMGNNFYEISSGHGDLPDDSIVEIMGILGLSADGLPVIDYGNLDSKMIFYIASPAHLELTCGDNSYVSDSMGFVVVDKLIDFSMCSVKVVADGDGGEYKLIVGDGQNLWWSKFEGKVLTGQEDRYWFDKRGVLIKNDDVFSVYSRYCVELQNDYEGDEFLVDCLLACEQKDADWLVNSVFGFRDRHRNFDISWEMMDKLIPLLRADNIDEHGAEYVLKNGQAMFDLVEMVAELKLELGVETDDFGVESFGLARKVFDTTEVDYIEGDYTLVDARFNLSKKILMQVW